MHCSLMEAKHSSTMSSHRGYDHDRRILPGAKHNHGVRSCDYNSEAPLYPQEDWQDEVIAPESQRRSAASTYHSCARNNRTRARGRIRIVLLNRLDSRISRALHAYRLLTVSRLLDRVRRYRWFGITKNLCSRCGKDYHCVHGTDGYDRCP